ncbi:hypothetical protein ACSNOI_42625 [Actinomadura kijaniata]|uniref:hypothetical protein n=1 Tax=Actinomadura kijaniata TaxID=46161 RepID=UPI003F19A92A
MTTDEYFEVLTARLRERGVPADRAAATAEELAGHVAESGADPREELGDAADLAARLAPDAHPGPGPESDPTAETWVWTADAFQDVILLNRYGDQGWEVERIDGLGRFVSHRDAENPLRWEYRRETVLPGRAGALAERLAPDGWEPCGSWTSFAYFKRPLAASEGPLGALADVPETPGRRRFWSRRFHAFVAVYLLVIAALVLTNDLTAGFGVGMAAGSALAVLILAFAYLRARR